MEGSQGLYECKIINSNSVIESFGRSISERSNANKNVILLL